MAKLSSSVGILAGRLKFYFWIANLERQATYLAFLLSIHFVFEKDFD